MPQTTLEGWAVDEKADIKDGRLFVGSDKSSFAVIPAVHFAKLVSGSDEKKLLAKVKTQEELHAMGAEQMSDSVILGEAAYEVVPGYMTELPVPPGDRPPGKPSNSEADLLAAFLLDKMT